MRKNLIGSFTAATVFAGAVFALSGPASAQPLHIDANFAHSTPSAEAVRFGGGGFHGGGFGGHGFGGHGFGGHGFGGHGFGGRGFGGRGYYGGGYGRGYYGRGYGYGGYGYGLASGLLLGGALAYPYYYGGYYPRSYYYDDSSDATVYEGSSGNEAYCARRFKSYDPRSGTYLGFDGRRHRCG